MRFFGVDVKCMKKKNDQKFEIFWLCCVASYAACGEVSSFQCDQNWTLHSCFAHCILVLSFFRKFMPKLNAKKEILSRIQQIDTKSEEICCFVHRNDNNNWCACACYVCINTRSQYSILSYPVCWFFAWASMHARKLNQNWLSKIFIQLHALCKILKKYIDSSLQKTHSSKWANCSFKIVRTLINIFVSLNVKNSKQSKNIGQNIKKTDGFWLTIRNNFFAHF